MNSLAAVILAAGQSKRMGQPKMLLPWGGTTVIGRVIATFAEASLNEIVIVTGGAREAVERETERLGREYPVRCVHNPQYESGEMLSSLQAGLLSLGTQFEAALIGLGDQPQLSLAAVHKVISANEANTAQLIVPSYNMRRGHPWLVNRFFWPALFALKSPQTLRDFLNTFSTKILYVESDQTILKDLDTPEDYLKEKPCI